MEDRSSSSSNLGDSTGAMASRRQRTVWKAGQQDALLAAFAENPYPSFTARQDLARELGLPESRIRVWFQNRRNRTREVRGLRGPEGSAGPSGLASPQQRPQGPGARARGGRSRPAERRTRRRTRLSPAQLRILLQAYEDEASLKYGARVKLAQETGLPEDTISIWFQNRRRQRTVWKAGQLDALLAAFAKNPYPSFRARQDLARELGLPESRIRVWFQNRRNRTREVRGLRGPEGSAGPRGLASPQQRPKGPGARARGGRSRPEEGRTRRRTRLSPAQLRILLQAYEVEASPKCGARVKLAQETGLPEDTISIWFQNRRRQRTVWKAGQQDALLAAFAENPYPSFTARQDLARELGLPESRIRVCFQNRRNRNGGVRGHQGPEGSAGPSGLASSQQRAKGPGARARGGRSRPAERRTRRRTRLSPAQLRILLQAYEDEASLKYGAMVKLAQETGLPEDTISIWFQNR
ncbi:zinc fingers and homeoboxes protein 3-like, partial [Peromyscus eremicus]|uniref:zinc fingers and homeoboxes protein 3-like n=1 Tax=Peromyscus eremicus TaxID=42410 RepID=UPI0027DD7CBD